MISSIRIQGFKSIVDQKIDLGLFNVLVGANGSGKSNILEAIGVLGAAAFGSVEPETLRYRGVRIDSPPAYKSSFKNRKYRVAITLEAHSQNGASYSVSLRNPIESPDPKWSFSHEKLVEQTEPIFTRGPRGTYLHSPNKRELQLEGESGGVKLALADRGDANKANQLIKLVSSYAIFTPTTQILRGVIGGVERTPLGLDGIGLPKALDEIIDYEKAKIGDIDFADILEFVDWAKDIRVVHFENPESSFLFFRDKYMKRGRDWLPEGDVSEGVLYLLFIIVHLCHPASPKFLSIDNFDQTMHPRLSRAITTFVADELIERNDRQFIVTTHNPMVLDGLDISDDRIRLFAVDRNDYGATEISRIQLSDEALKLIKDDDWLLSELWVEGRLGGVPKLI
ncbi:MAG: ATP-binding protein [Calditrichaeota bacterium]|nr:ATP-binding protein [Calditrichota bacterium]